MSTLIIVILIFVIVLAFFTGAEVAFISANKLSIEVEKNRGTRVGHILARLYDKPREFLGALLVGSNIALVIIALLTSQVLIPYFIPILGEGWQLILLNTVIITIVVLLFGEFLPKVFCKRYANEVMYFLAYPLSFTQWCLKIPTWIITKLSNVCVKYVFRAGADADEVVITRLDLQDFVEGSTAPVQNEIETDIFKNALHLREVRVSNCMVPRPEIVHIDVNAPMTDVITLFQSSRHSRVLVIDGDLDHVLGYMHHQQLLKPMQTLRESLFEIPFVPETMTAKDLMLNLIRDENSIACVVDEFGGTAGIITLEDILEEIFGEIEDEHDEEDFLEMKINDDEYLFAGRLDIDHLNAKYPELKLPEGDYHTLSGYLVMTSGTVPDQGESLVLGDYKFVCEAVTDKKIETIRVIRLNPEDGSDRED